MRGGGDVGDGGDGTPWSEVVRTIRERDPLAPSTRLRRQTKTGKAIASRHACDERSLIRQLAGDLDWICLKALDKDPDRRYSSASELAEDVRRHLAHLPVLAGRPSVAYRVRKFVRRNRVGVAATALVLVAASVGIVTTMAAREQALASDRLARAAMDAERIVGLEAEAAKLWPPHPEQIPDMEY